MKLAVVLNETAGTLLGRPVAGTVAELRQRFAAAGAEASVCAAPGPAVEAAIRTAVASDAEAVIIGGGDGTVATAAGLLLGTGKALGLLPLGTMNLLARDLGMPADWRAAVAVLAAGVRRPIDIGEVNGRVFLNNSVIGLYPTLVRARERQRGVPGWRKWPAMASAVLKALRYYNLIEVEVDLGHGPRLIRTPALAVVNNVYRDPAATFLNRPTLDGGQLAVYVAQHQTRLGLVRLMAGLALGGWQSNAELDSLTMTDLTVTSHARRRLKVAIDGEVTRLTPPLVYRIRPKALSVLVP
ncbi:MAG: diacylglycerol kinase family protein [Rhodospirillaceae bacterium]